MSSYDINSNEIQLVFMNTEAINIDYWAINQFDFKTCGVTHKFDKERKRMDMVVKLESLFLDVDIRDPRYFRHSHRLVDEDSIKLDGEACLVHLWKTPDITHLYFNGTMYEVPWEYESHRTASGLTYYTNKLQSTSEMTTSDGDHSYTVEIHHADDAVCIYHNQGEPDGKVNISVSEGKDASQT
jgi:hypothetical protein